MEELLLIEGFKLVNLLFEYHIQQTVIEFWKNSVRSVWERILEDHLKNFVTIIKCNNQYFVTMHYLIIK